MEVEQMLNMYRLGFRICLGMAVFFLLLAVLMFFKFHIPALLVLRSGRTRQKGIQKLETLNAQTGRLTIGTPSEPGGIRRGVTITRAETKKRGITGGLSEGHTGRLKKAYAPAAAPKPSDGSGTTVLQESAVSGWLQQPVKTSIRFDIEKDIILVHSDEVI